MTGKFNFDLSTATSITPTNDGNGNPTKYTITGISGNGAPEKVEINVNQGMAKCEFDAYYFYDGNSRYSPDFDAPTPQSSTRYGCNGPITVFFGMYLDDSFKNRAFINLFSNSNRSSIVISKNNGSKNYCHFSVDMQNGEDCRSLKYCEPNSCNMFFENSDNSKMTSANANFIPSGITSINITCPTSSNPIVIPYSYSGFTPTFDSVTKELTFTSNDGITGTKSLGGTDSNSIATYITDIDKWNGEFDMSFFCNSDGKLNTNWGDLVFDPCTP